MAESWVRELRDSLQGMPCADLLLVVLRVVPGHKGVGSSAWEYGRARKDLIAGPLLATSLELSLFFLPSIRSWWFDPMYLA